MSRYYAHWYFIFTFSMIIFIAFLSLFRHDFISLFATIFHFWCRRCRRCCRLLSPITPFDWCWLFCYDDYRYYFRFSLIAMDNTRFSLIMATATLFSLYAPFFFAIFEFSWFSLRHYFVYHFLSFYIMMMLSFHFDFSDAITVTYFIQAAIADFFLRDYIIFYFFDVIFHWVMKIIATWYWCTLSLLTPISLLPFVSLIFFADFAADIDIDAAAIRRYFVTIFSRCHYALFSFFRFSLLLRHFHYFLSLRYWCRRHFIWIFSMLIADDATPFSTHFVTSYAAAADNIITDYRYFIVISPIPPLLFSLFDLRIIIDYLFRFRFATLLHLFTLSPLLSDIFLYSRYIEFSLLIRDVSLISLRLLAIFFRRCVDAYIFSHYFSPLFIIFFRHYYFLRWCLMPAAYFRYFRWCLLSPFSDFRFHYMICLIICFWYFADDISLFFSPLFDAFSYS